MEYLQIHNERAKALQSADFSLASDDLLKLQEAFSILTTPVSGFDITPINIHNLVSPINKGVPAKIRIEHQYMSYKGLTTANDMIVGLNEPYEFALSNQFEPGNVRITSKPIKGGDSDFQEFTATLRFEDRDLPEISVHGGQDYTLTRMLANVFLVASLPESLLKQVTDSTNNILVISLGRHFNQYIEKGVDYILDEQPFTALTLSPADDGSVIAKSLPEGQYSDYGKELSKQMRRHLSTVGHIFFLQD